MGKITIGVIRQRRRMIGPDKDEIVTEIPYTTEKGYVGLVKIKGDRLNEKQIIDAVKEDARVIEKLIGVDIEV